MKNNSDSRSDFLFNKSLLKSKRSQSAIEFMILVIFFLFSFTAFFIAIQWNMSDKLSERQALAVKNIAITVQDEINLASQSSDGYYRQFKLPEEINGREYDIEIIGDIVYVRTVDGRYALTLPIKNVTGDVLNKMPDINTIKKEDGIIKLNPE